MLGKSLKYEFMATARIFLPLFSGLLLFSAINRIMFSLFPFISQLLIGLYIFVLIASFVAAAVFLIQRFFKGITGDEGYLSLTLPIKAGTHLITKAIAGFTWILSTIVISLLAVIVMITDKNIYTAVAAIFNELGEAFTQAGRSPASFIILIVAFLLIVLFEQLMRVYTSIAIGQLSNTNRALYSVVAYLVIYFAINIVIVTPIMLAVLLQFFDIKDIFSPASQSIINANSNPKIIFDIIYVVFGIETAIMGVLSVAHFFVTKYIIKNKINLA